MSGHAGSRILSTYFELGVVEQTSVEPAGDYQDYFAGEERALRRWLAPRLAAVRPLIAAMVARGLPLSSRWRVTAGEPAQTEVAETTELDGNLVDVVLGVVPARALEPHELGSLRAALRAAIAAPADGTSDDAAVAADVRWLQESPFYLDIRARITAIDATCEAACRDSFESTAARLAAALAAHAGSLPLVANSPEIRQGVDGHWTVTIERGWLEISVVMRTHADYHDERERIEWAIDDALRA